MTFHVSSLPTVRRFNPRTLGFMENWSPSSPLVSTSSLFSFSPLERPHWIVQVYAVSPWVRAALAKFSFNPSPIIQTFIWLQQSTEISLQESWTSNNFPRWLTKSALTTFSRFCMTIVRGWDWVQSVPMSICLTGCQVGDHLHVGSHNFHKLF